MNSLADQESQMEDAGPEGVLHLSTIDGTFDSARDLAIGPHCFIGRDEALPEWQSLVFAEPFPDEAALEIADENIRGLINYLLPGIADKLNAYHGTSYSVDFWRVLVLPWLIELAQKTWTSFSRLSMIVDQCDDRPMTVKVCQGDFEWRFEDTGDFFNTMLKDYRLNWWIDSYILAVIAPDNWRLLPSEPISHPVIASAGEPPSPKPSGKIRETLRNLKYWLGYTDIPGIRWSGLLLGVYVHLLPKSPSRLHFALDPDFRPGSHFPASFLNVLNELIDATMPESFLDGFTALAEKARRLPTIPGRLRLGVLSNWNEQEKVIAAFAKEAGEKRVQIQHGGEYGMLKYNIMANEVELRSTIFISWGWAYDEPNGSPVIPLPSPFHSKIANRHQRQNDSIIYVASGARLLMSRIHWVTRINSPIRRYNESIRFLENLKDPVRKPVVYRPNNRSASDFDVRDVVSEQFPEMPMLETSLHAALLKCRLAVLCHFGTTMNLSMAANIPTVVYQPPDLMTPRKEAEPFFEPLRRCGVIHDSPESAARHLNRIYDDIEGWWYGPDVQEARKIWVHQFARTDRFWWWTWVKALAQMKDVG